MIIPNDLGIVPEDWLVWSVSIEETLTNELNKITKLKTNIKHIFSNDFYFNAYSYYLIKY